MLNELIESISTTSADSNSIGDGNQNLESKIQTFHRNKTINELPSRNNIVGPFRAAAHLVMTLRLRRCRNMNSLEYDDDTDASTPLLEQHAAQIAKQMEEDENFMQDNPLAKQHRIEFLREMTHCLSIKRAVKQRLDKSSKKVNSRPITSWKLFKYRIGMSLSKCEEAVRSLSDGLKLWHGTLKRVEGHCGSGVVTYFQFLRSMFTMNLFLLLISVAFLVLPQLLYQINETEFSYTNGSINFIFMDLITGEGYLTDTILYYGVYGNHSFSLDDYTYYNMPLAYFFTMMCLYIICFFGLSIQMAKTYRKNFIETAGGLKNVYANKVFCSWDFNIADEKAANLNSQIIYHELRELLDEERKQKQKISWLRRFWSFMTKVSVHGIVLFILVLTMILLWKLLKLYYNTKYPNISDSNDDRKITPRQSFGLLVAFTITTIMNIYPKLFSFIVRYEDYSSPRIALYITLLRTFVLESVIMIVLVTFWLSRKFVECWETNLAQEVYRLIVMDFLFSFVVLFICRICHYLIYTRLTQRFIPVPEFDIAHNTLDLIYSQTLFWVGFFFSPLLPLVIILKIFLQFYMQRTSVLYFSIPPRQTWRAAQTKTLYLVMTFTSLLVVIINYIYILSTIKPSNCGPFQDYDRFVQKIFQGIFQLQQDNTFIQVLTYLTKPGIIGGLLIAMSVAAYYLRAKANSQIAMANILREMLISEGRDKDFLLDNISKLMKESYLAYGPTSEEYIRESEEYIGRFSEQNEN